MFSLWETFGITTAASLLGFLSVCVPFATKETGGWNWKGLPYRIFRQHCWMRTPVLRDAVIFHYASRWLPWPPSKGQTAARSLLVHFARGQRCCLAAQQPVLKTLLANHGFPAFSVICLVQEATDLLTTNLQSPLKTFPGWRASALTTLLEPRVAPQMCFSQTIFKGPARSAKFGAAQIRCKEDVGWAWILPALSWIAYCMHWEPLFQKLAPKLLGLPCLEVLCKLGGWYALPGCMLWLPDNVWPWPATRKSAEGNIFQLSSRWVSHGLSAPI